MVHKMRKKSQKQIVKKEPKKESAYVEITAPTDARRHSLESARSFLLILQKFEKLDELREQRTRTVAIFTKELQEISKLLAEANQKLPKVKIAMPHKEQEETVEERVISHEPHEEVMDELKEIEKRLKELQ